MPSNLTLGLCLAAFISIGATAAGALTGRAALAATVLGGIVFAAGGVGWSLPLLAFFVTSSLLSRKDRHTTRKGTWREPPRRTARQVVANGFMPGLCGACYLLFPVDAWSVLFASALATAAADTWATELGRRSVSAPRDLLTGRRVRTGTSGGVTLPGLAASLGGSSTVVVACIVGGVIRPAEALPIALAGFSGALVDSLLGSALQERRWCPLCLEETEDAIHRRCSTPTSYLRGAPSFDNDWVNLSAGACGSVLGLAFTHLMM